jgi:hypothetical protein
MSTKGNDTVTLDQFAREYAALLNGPANGLGQHVHPVHGRSDVMLYRMVKTYGDAAAHAAIDAALAERRAS